jgi:hypothetical protein
LYAVKLVAEVERAAGNTVIESHCFHWTGVDGLTDEDLSKHLMPPDWSAMFVRPLA